MQLEQSFTLPFARAAAWPAFQDVPLLIGCMPGAGLQGSPRVVDGGVDLDLLFSVKLGPIAAAFAGQGAVRYDQAASAGVFSGSGTDKKSNSRVKGEARFALSESATGETLVQVNVDYALTGALAQFSRAGIVKELANALTRDFAANLQQEIGKRHAQEQAPALAAVATGSDGAGPADEAELPAAQPARAQVAQPQLAAAAPLNAGKLFWRVLWARIARWFGRTA